MGFGSNGAILRVNLTEGTTSVETFDEAFYRQYPGGKALAAYHLLREMPAGADPLGPDNVLVLATGLLTGAPVSTATRFNAIARSPLTGGFGESEAGGYWGPELKMAGYDAIVLTGRAPSPVWLWIKDGAVEIRDASALWGQDPPFVQDAIREATGEKLVRVLQIGRAGENQVPYAMLMNELRHYNGRTGMGAVMGSKNVRAIAVKGSHRYLSLAHDPKALGDIGKRLAKTVTEHPQSWDLRTKGTPGLTDGLNAAGILPTRNFRLGSFEQVQGIGWNAYEAIRSGTGSCYACAVRCKPETAFQGRYTVTETYDGPEYEAVAGFGSNCAIFDIQLVARANELCNELGIDVISAAGTIAFVMECVEHGLLGPDDLGGLDLRFGNGEAVLAALPLIADRRGAGELLALGSRKIAERVGQGSAEFAMQVKGLELAMHEPRGKVGVALGYATNEAGADHLVGFHDPIFVNPESVAFKGAMPLGITEPSPARDLGPTKVGIWYTGERWNSAEKVLGLCFFGPAPRSFIQVGDVVDAVRAATGWDVTVDELLEIGERAVNLARMFNIREGFSRADDHLPGRLHTPLEGGPLTGTSIDRDDFEAAISALYGLKGWDEASGVPTGERLDRLGLAWTAAPAGAGPG
ncbi:MAG: aldehyde ferredoxin oxidoreductase family protein [Chloroflexota bacterium]